MIERIALILVLALTGMAAYYVLRLAHVRRMQPRAATGLPTLLYFHSDTCAVCPTQGRFVDQIAARWDGRLRIERIDAGRDIEATARYRVFTLPTTVLVDSEGKVHQVNYGLADPQKLERQLSAIAATHPEPPGSTKVMASMKSAPSTD